MPVRNEAGHLDAAIDAALAQDYEGALELVIADGESTDGTRRRLDERARADSRIKVVDNPVGNAAAGLNAAIAAASGEVLVRCDGHAELPPEYVRTAVEILSETGAANVGGVQAATGTGAIQRAIAVAMTSPLGVGDSRFHYSSSPGPTDTVYLGTFDRASVEEVGGFDESLTRNQDYDLNHRLRSAGRLVWFDPRLRVTYRARPSLGALWRQYYDYGRWKRRMLESAPKALKARQLAPPLLVLGLAVSGVLAVTGTFGAAVVPALYGAFVGLGTLIEVVRRRDLTAFLLPIVLPVMHLGWGLGFLFGRASAVPHK